MSNAFVVNVDDDLVVTVDMKCVAGPITFQVIDGAVLIRGIMND